MVGGWRMVDGQAENRGPWAISDPLRVRHEAASRAGPGGRRCVTPPGRQRLDVGGATEQDHGPSHEQRRGWGSMRMRGRA